MRNLVPILAALIAAAAPAAAQDTTLAARILRVENGLTTPVIVAGEGEAGMPLAERMRASSTPAVSIAVIRGGRIQWARAYGVLQAGGSVAADTATLFQAASISKPVAALGALLLVEGGRLSLDADVNTFLRSWKVPENAFTTTEKVTLRRIISHTAGLTVSGFPGYAADSAMPTTRQILEGERPANTAPVRVDTFPGARLRYSGGGLTVMQQMLMDVTGRPFAGFLGETVLAPLGMAHSSFEQEVAAERAARTARAHDPQGAPVEGGWNRYPEMAAAGLWTTPSDLARFALAVHHAAKGVQGGLISPALARRMLTQESGAPQNGFGLGLQVDLVGTPAMNFGHSGANRGYRANMVLFPETGDGVVIMTNSDAGNGVMFELLRSVAREYGWPAQGPIEKTAFATEAAALRDFPGRYRGEVEGQEFLYSVTAADGALFINAPSWPEARRLYAASATEARFFIRESTREYVFDRDASGRVVRLRAVGGGPELITRRVD